MAKKFIEVLEYKKTKARGVIANRPTGNQISVNQVLTVWAELVEVLEVLEGEKERFLARVYLVNGTSILGELNERGEDSIEDSIFATVNKYSAGVLDASPIIINRNFVLSISSAGKGLFQVKTALNSFITDGEGVDEILNPNF